MIDTIKSSDVKLENTLNEPSLKKSKISLLYLCAYSDKRTGGVRSVVPQYLKYISEVANVRVFSYRKVRFDSARVKYHQIQSKRELLKILGSVDMVIFHEVYYLEYFKFANRLVRLDIPYIIIPHCSLTTGAQEQKGQIKKVINKLWVNKFVERAVRVQYLSDYEKDNSKLFEAKSIIIPNGVIGDCVRAKKYDARNFFKILFVGRFSVRQKGLDVLMEACLLIKNEMAEKNIQLSLYGTDFEGGKSEIENKIKDYGLENNVKVFAPIYGEEKQRILNDSDIFILTSRFEGLPMGILEAMQVGLPILVTPGTGFYDVVKQEKCGWCAQCTSDSIAKAIIKASGEKDEWKSMSDNAIRVVKQNYAWNKVADVTKQEYEKLLLVGSNGVGHGE